MWALASSFNDTNEDIEKFDVEATYFDMTLKRSVSCAFTYMDWMLSVACKHHCVGCVNGPEAMYAEKLVFPQIVARATEECPLKASTVSDHIAGRRAFNRDSQLQDHDGGLAAYAWAKTSESQWLSKDRFFDTIELQIMDNIVDSFGALKIKADFLAALPTEAKPVSFAQVICG